MALTNEQVIDRLNQLIAEMGGGIITAPKVKLDSFDRIQEAIRVASDGAVLKVEPGEYNGNLKVIGRHLKKVILQVSEPDKPCTFVGVSSDEPTMYNLDGEGRGFSFVGLTFKHKISSQCIVSFDAKVEGYEASDIALIGCNILGDSLNGQRRGLNFNGSNMIVSGCNVRNIKYDGQDTQAILIYNGKGPYLIEDSYLEASGENLMVGGADPKFPNLVPSGIKILGNKFVKPLEWMPLPWDVKNLLEFKNAQDVTVDGNYFNGNWVSNQAGYAILVTPRNQDGSAPWSVTRRIGFYNNLIENVSSVFNISGDDDEQKSERTEDIEIYNNLAITNHKRFSGVGRFIMIGRGPNGLNVTKNTSFNSGEVWIYTHGVTPHGKIPRAAFTDNIGIHRSYGFMGDAVGVGNPAISKYYDNPAFEGNVLIGGKANQYPMINIFPAQPSSGLLEYFNPDYSPRKEAVSWSDKGADLSKLPMNLLENLLA